ncbi:MAG: transposase [Gammaproteobacteria bacterium]|nr:transposase [Gammaproteobacteria bacterium]
MANGLLNFSVWGYVAAALIMTHITIAAVTIYLHRHQAHRALDLHPVISHFFRFWLWLTTGMVTKAWAAIHRKHHAKCETEEDPHSPQVLGIKKVLLEGSELYRKEAKNQETLDKYGHGTPDDWIERHLYTPHSKYGIVLMLITDILLFGVAGITIWAVQMLWIPITAAGMINGIGHYWGYRNYEPQDASTNIMPWGIIIGGEELHNNHHAFPSSAKLSSKPWEFDIGWLYIRTMETFGLAKVKKVAPEPVIVAGKQAVDMETLRAVIVNRLHVLSHYGREVVQPVLKDELRKADDSCRALLARGRRLLVRDQSLMDEAARNQLHSVLDRSQELRTVYQYRQKLQEIWQRSTVTQDSLLHSLQEWCHQAEETGIKRLQDFSKSLRGYTMGASAA